MHDGKPLFWHLYPSFPWKGACRKRLYTYLDKPNKHGKVKMLDENGEVTEMDNDANLYDNLKRFIRSSGRTVYTPRLDLGTGRNTLVFKAATDGCADVSYNPKSGLSGISFKHTARNQRAGALLLDRTWQRDNDDVYDWLAAIRRTSDIVGVGDYDSCGSFGQATLSRFWTENNLRRIWRLPEDLSDVLDRYSIGGRAEYRGSSSTVYPHAIEYDLSSAYPTATARGLPVGNPVYHSRDFKFGDREAVFGTWRLTIHEDIPFSPIPVRDWDSKGGPISWSLEKGWLFDYAGWDDEIAALMETGRASAEFVSGWSWSRLSTLLAPWVDQMVSLRSKCESSEDDQVAKHIKMITNAAIGRWGMSNEQWDIVPDKESRMSMGDQLLEYEPGTVANYSMGSLTGLWVRPVCDKGRNTLPYHWSSYVKMVVRMELYRMAVSEMERGSIILSTNFDSILCTASPQGSNQTDVIVEQSKRPWNWKRKEMQEVQLPFNRGLVFRMEDGKVEARLPGVHGAARQKVIEQFNERSEHGQKGEARRIEA